MPLLENMDGHVKNLNRNIYSSYFLHYITYNRIDYFVYIKREVANVLFTWLLPVQKSWVQTVHSIISFLFSVTYRQIFVLVSLNLYLYT